jgi:hypothetical protein
MAPFITFFFYRNGATKNGLSAAERVRPSLRDFFAMALPGGNGPEV